MFHVLNAKITFGNIGGGECAVEGVHAIRADMQETGEDGLNSTEGEEDPLVPGLAARCVIESTCFDAPADYREVNLDQPVAPLRDEEDEMLQLVIQQSLLEYQQDPSQIMTLQALQDSRQQEDDDLQRAIRESMREGGVDEGQTPQVVPVQRQPGDGTIAYDEDLQLAMALSEQQLEEDERLRKQEEEQLAQVIQLSLAES